MEVKDLKDFPIEIKLQIIEFIPIDLKFNKLNQYYGKYEKKLVFLFPYVHPELSKGNLAIFGIVPKLKITNLSLCRCPNLILKPNFFKIINKHQYIKSLDAKQIDLNEKEVITLLYLDHLQSLSMGFIFSNAKSKSISHQGFELDKIALKTLEKSKLKKFIWKGENLSSLTGLEKNSSIESLEIHLNSHLYYFQDNLPINLKELYFTTYLGFTSYSVYKEKESVFQNISKKDIHSLSIIDHQIYLKPFISHPHLTYLDISSTEIKDDPKNLEKITNLKFLRLSQSQVNESTKMDVDFSKLNLETLIFEHNLQESNLDSIGNIRSLKRLFICSNRLNDQLIKKLKNLPNLEYIDLSYNYDLTQDTVDYLSDEKVFPNLKLIGCYYFRSKVSGSKVYDENSLMSYLKIKHL